jgi:uncharacterized integral membrane protein
MNKKWLRSEVMQVTLIISLIFAIFIALFAAVNGGEVTINLFFWKLEGVSQAMVILGSAAVGAVLVYMSGMMNRFKQARKVKELEKKVASLEKELGAAKPEALIKAEPVKEEIPATIEDNKSDKEDKTEV